MGHLYVVSIPSAAAARSRRTQDARSADMNGLAASARAMLMGDMCALRFTRLTPESLPAVEPWFDDRETIRFLGDRNWVRRALRLVHETPGTEYRGRTVVGRDVWMIIFKHIPVGFIEVERYDDRCAECALVVAPAMRRQGIGRAILDAVWERPELAEVEELIGGVEPENVASRRCLEAAGFRLSSEPDKEGMLQGTRARSGSGPAAAPERAAMSPKIHAPSDTMAP
jgi:RimJ/RimL family protein N-acetyltransferase